MVIDIMSRKSLEILSQTPFLLRTAIISICDYDDLPITLEHEPASILHLKFDDVDVDYITERPWKSIPKIERFLFEREYHMISDTQAQEIASFIMAQLPLVDRIICQCEYGQSRSAAIAAAILEFTERKGLSVFIDDAYNPNKLVFRKVYEYLTCKL